MHDRPAMCTMSPAADAVLCNVGGRFPAARGLQDAAPKSMMISSLLTPELVLPALPAQAKAQVLETLAAHVGLVHPHVDSRRLADALHERERQSTTALENGVAIPHVRLAGLRGPLAALARTAAGISCGAADGRDRKSTRLNSSHGYISYAVFCLKKKNEEIHTS